MKLLLRVFWKIEISVLSYKWLVHVHYAEHICGLTTELTGMGMPMRDAMRVAMSAYRKEVCTVKFDLFAYLHIRQQQFDADLIDINSTNVLQFPISGKRN